MSEIKDAELAVVVMDVVVVDSEAGIDGFFILVLYRSKSIIGTELCDLLFLVLLISSRGS